jgi:FAD/FMN-containing dehydrogenase
MSGRQPDFEKLASTLDGTVVLPTDAAFERAGKVWNSRFDDLRPRAVVEVGSTEDVQRTILFAHEHELRVLARNGRHSFAGYSTDEGAVVVDVSRLTELDVSADRERGRLGAGFTVLGAYRALWPWRVSIPGGTCPSVGVTGLATVGGLGYLTRLHGLTCDALTAVEIVTADGRVRRASEEEHPDLFWAVRGAGAGNFGIIVALEFRLAPVDMPFTFARYDFSWESACGVLSAWQEWIHDAPRELTSHALVMTSEHAKPAVTIEVTYGGDPGRVEPLLAALAGAARAKPVLEERSTGGWASIPVEEYGKGLRPQECQDEEVSRSGRLPRISFYGKSDVASQPWPAAGFDTLVEWIERRQLNRALTPGDFSATHDLGKVWLEPCDGAVNEVAPDASAFVHRGTTRFVAQYQARWRGEHAAANIEWMDGLYEAVVPYRSGMAYQGYMDPRLPDWQHAYYGENFPRLREIKSKHDPDDFFRFARSIPPS